MEVDQVVAIEHVFTGDGPASARVWSAYLLWAQSCGLAEEKYELIGRAKPLHPREVERVLARGSGSIFEASGASSKLSFQPARHGVMLASVFLSARFGIDILDSLASTFNALTGMVYARTYEPEYERWQNEKRLGAFEAFGRPVADLTLVWDKTMERNYVDITRNPGRAMPESGYTEALGQYMWLTSHFWDLSGSNRSEVCVKLQCTSVSEGLERVHLSETPLCESNPPSEELRSLLFPRSASLRS